MITVNHTEPHGKATLFGRLAQLGRGIGGAFSRRLPGHPPPLPGAGRPSANGHTPPPAREFAARVAAHIKQNCPHYFREAAEYVRRSDGSDVDYWSIIQVYEVLIRPGRVLSVYCKMPKSRWGLTSPELLAQDPAAAEMARSEFQSLRRLAALFQGADPCLRVIRALDLLSPPSAILSEGVPGSREIFRFLRDAGRSRRAPAAALDVLKKCGLWLAHLHSRNPPDPGLPPTPCYAAQLAGFRAALDSMPPGRRPRRIGDYIARAEQLAPDEDPPTYNVEGFEVRNFISSGDALFFLDPVVMSVGSRYEDIARFLASLAILHWGSIRLLRPYPAEAAYADAFLEGYQGVCGRLRPPLLSSYLIKEYLRLWLLGLQVLDFKRLPRLLDWVGRAFYLPGFFCRRIEGQFAHLGC
jgi:hypothetical protein